MHRSIVAHKHRIDLLFGKVRAVRDPADQAEWAKYLCVLVSGYIEESLRTLLEDYLQKHASPVIQTFVSAEISWFTNCKTSKISAILQRFDPAWRDQFIFEIAAQSTVTDEIKNAIDSVVTNRHQIAHGKSIGITYARMSRYYGNIQRAVQILEATIR